VAPAGVALPTCRACVPGWPVCNCTLGACSIRERDSSMHDLVFSSELGVLSFSMFETGTCSL